MVKATSCNKYNISDCYSTDNVTIGNQHTFTITITLPSHMSFTMQIIIQYNSGQRFESQNDNVVSKSLVFL